MCATFASLFAVALSRVACPGLVLYRQARQLFANEKLDKKIEKLLVRALPSLVCWNCLHREQKKCQQFDTGVSQNAIEILARAACSDSHSLSFMLFLQPDGFRRNHVTDEYSLPADGKVRVDVDLFCMRQRVE